MYSKTILSDVLTITFQTSLSEIYDDACYNRFGTFFFCLSQGLNGIKIIISLEIFQI